MDSKRSDPTLTSTAYREQSLGSSRASKTFRYRDGWGTQLTLSLLVVVCVVTGLLLAIVPGCAIIGLSVMGAGSIVLSLRVMLTERTRVIIREDGAVVLERRSVARRKSQQEIPPGAVRTVEVESQYPRGFNIIAR